MSTSHLTIREAARELGISIKSVRSRARFRSVPMIQEDGPYGARYLIAREDLAILAEESPQGGSVGTPRETGPVEAGEEYPFTVEDDPEEEQASPQEARTRTGRRTVSEGSPGNPRGHSPDTVPLWVHAQALQALQKAQDHAVSLVEDALRSERRAAAMEYELHGYQRALTEQAESLQARTAKVQQARSLLEEQQNARARLEAENAALRASYEASEAERLTALESLHTSQSRVTWLEQRVPKWVRRAFGAG